MKKRACFPLLFTARLGFLLLLLPAHAQPAPQHGATVIWYDTESFSSPTATNTAATVDLSGTRLYDSAVVTGYLAVTNTASHDLRLEAAATGEFTFDGSMVGGALGSAGICLPSLNDTRVLTNRQLVAGQYYPFQLRLRTGCSLYPYHLRLQWRPAGSGNYETVPNDALYTAVPPPVTNVVMTIYHAVEICWPTVSNRHYQVQWASSVDTNNWQALGNEILGNGMTNCVFDTTRTTDKRFYRVLSWE